LALAIKDQLLAKGYAFDLPFVTEYCRLMKDRAVFLNDLPTLGTYFFEDIETYDIDSIHKKYKKENRNTIEAIVDQLNATNDFSHQTLETVIKTYIADNGLKIGEIMPVLRLALAGTMQGPTIFDMMALFGKEKSIARIKKSLNYFDAI
jgi:glutamyl-tRNA synthetase